MKKILAILISGLVIGAAAQEYITAPPEVSKIVPPTPEWIAKVTELAPAKPTVKPKAPRRILMFSNLCKMFWTADCIVRKEMHEFIVQGP